MKSAGPIRLFASTSQQQKTLPDNTICVDLFNKTAATIRYAFVTGKVNDPSITENPTYMEFDVLGPYAFLRVYMADTSSAVFYYATNFVSAELVIDPYTA